MSNKQTKEIPIKKEMGKIRLGRDVVDEIDVFSKSLDDFILRELREPLPVNNEQHIADIEDFMNDIVPEEKAIRVKNRTKQNPKQSSSFG
jgi:hypothetical protein